MMCHVQKALNRCLPSKESQEQEFRSVILIVISSFPYLVLGA